MGYDIHVVRTTDWADAAKNPIRLDEVDAIIKSDPELQWSKTDYVDVRDRNGKRIRTFAIVWRGSTYFWWDQDQIIYKATKDAALVIKKLLQIAAKLKARVVGDEGEVYSIRRGFFGGETLIQTDESGKTRAVD